MFYMHQHIFKFIMHDVNIAIYKLGNMFLYSPGAT